MTSGETSLDIIIVGGGLVGALSACFLAKRGHRVRIYEYRSDVRVESSRGVSIDLALSVRGREALRAVGLEDTIVNHHGTPMKGRMIHNVDGTVNEILYDKVNKNCIYSVNRTFLNKLLLDAAEKYTNVELHFDYKLIDGNLITGELLFLNTKTNEKLTTLADFILGCDGAYSLVRRLMSKKPMYNVFQKYINHGYVEISFPASADGKHIMSREHLHIWPRGEFMMIGLPNTDFKFTGNIFAPFDMLESINTPEKLRKFYEKYFPDALQIIGEDKLIEDFFQTSPKTLISIKCEPYHVGKTLIIGDAAHAMVPFYGQGMNCGFEDALILDSLMELYDSDIIKVLPHFSRIRCIDAQAMSDLAMYNYIEMRDLVNRKSYLLRKYMDTILYWLFPKTWIPLYQSVTFTRIRYHDCIKNKDWQDNILKNATICIGTFMVAITFLAIFKFWLTAL